MASDTYAHCAVYTVLHLLQVLLVLVLVLLFVLHALAWLVTHMHCTLSIVVHLLQVGRLPWMFLVKQDSSWLGSTIVALSH